MSTIDYIVNKFNIPSGGSSYEIKDFDRVKLADLFHDLNFQTGAEIGVEQGEYSEILCKANPLLELHGIDAWQVYRDYRDHTKQHKLDAFYDITKARMTPYNYKMIRKFSMDAVKDYPDYFFDFVYIDANHSFLPFTEDLHFWSKKVRWGGIVAGHDYYKENIPSHVHVPYVLQGYTKAYGIRPWFHFGDSWMYVKQ